jgi:hypothetical protein
MLIKFAPALAALALVVGLIRISLFLRSRGMRAFATRWGLQYVGPATFRWRLPLPRIKPPVPIPFPLNWWPANEIRQVWNVVEGQQGGVRVLIFDTFLGRGRGAYRTFFACKTEQNPFGLDKLRDQVVHSHGWTILYRVPFPLEVPWATWSIGIQRLEGHLNTLRVGNVVRA